VGSFQVRDVIFGKTGANDIYQTKPEDRGVVNLPGHGEIHLDPGQAGDYQVEVDVVDPDTNAVTRSATSDPLHLVCP
jgi:hypothetical protein